MRKQHWVVAPILRPCVAGVWNERIVFNPDSDFPHRNVCMLGKVVLTVVLQFLLSCCNTNTFLELFFLYIVLDNRGSALCICLVSLSIIMFALGIFVDIPYLTEKVFLYFLFPPWEFFSGTGIEFYQTVFLYRVIWSYKYFFQFVNIVDYINWFMSIELNLHPWIKLSFFIYSWILFANMLRSLVSIFMY